MSDFFFNYGLFLAKTVTIVFSIFLVLVFVMISASRKQGDRSETIEIKKINEKFSYMAMTMNASMMQKDSLKKYNKSEKEKIKQDTKSSKQGENKKRIFVINFQGDIRASGVSSLREEVTAILTVATEKDEVFVKLESSGGVVHGYGLGASQLMRLRSKNIPMVVSVDKVAASGGYMMACVADRIIAAPFSIIGSIGVIAQVPNFNKVLKNHDIEYEQFTAGEFKRTVTMFGENTDDAKSKFREEIEDIHILFKEFIVQHRPDVDIVKVSTGESWPGTRALEKNLVDELITSDDYLLESSKGADIYEVKFVSKKSLGAKFGLQMQRLADKFKYGVSAQI